MLSKSLSFPNLYNSVELRLSSIVMKPIVKCFYGRSGAGKTRDALELSGGPDCTFIVSRPDSGRPLWWDGYHPTTHVSIILDDFYGWIPWSYLLQLLDRYHFSVEVKGRKTPFQFPKHFYNIKPTSGEVVQNNSQ